MEVTQTLSEFIFFRGGSVNLGLHIGSDLVALGARKPGTTLECLPVSQEMTTNHDTLYRTKEILSRVTIIKASLRKRQARSQAIVL